MGINVAQRPSINE